MPTPLPRSSSARWTKCPTRRCCRGSSVSGPNCPCLRAALRWAASADGDPQRLVALVGVAGVLPERGRPRPRGAALDRGGAAVDQRRTPALHAARFWQAAAYRSVDPEGPDCRCARRLHSVRRDSFARSAMPARSTGCSASWRITRGVSTRRSTPPRCSSTMRALERPEWRSASLSVRLRPAGVALARSGRWQEYRDHFAAEAMRAPKRTNDELERWG